LKLKISTDARIYDEDKDRIRDNILPLSSISGGHTESYTFYLKSNSSLDTFVKTKIYYKNSYIDSDRIRHLIWEDICNLDENFDNFIDDLTNDEIPFKFDYEVEVLKDADADDNVIVRIGKLDLKVDPQLIEFEDGDIEIGGEIGGEVGLLQFGMKDLENGVVDKWMINALKCEGNASFDISEYGIHSSYGAMATIAEGKIETENINCLGLFNVQASGTLKVGTIGAKAKAGFQSAKANGDGELTLGFGLGAALGFDVEFTISW